MFQATESSRHGHTGPDVWEPSKARASVVLGAPLLVAPAGQRSRSPRRSSVIKVRVRTEDVAIGRAEIFAKRKAPVTAVFCDDSRRRARPARARHTKACSTDERPEVVMAREAGRTSGRSGEGRTRTGDTPVFSRVLYQLSYLAAGGGQFSPTASEEPRAGRRACRRDRLSGAPRRPPPRRRPGAAPGLGRRSARSGTGSGDPCAAVQRR